MKVAQPLHLGSGHAKRALEDDPFHRAPSTIRTTAAAVSIPLPQRHIGQALTVEPDAGAARLVRVTVRAIAPTSLERTFNNTTTTRTAASAVAAAPTDSITTALSITATAAHSEKRCAVSFADAVFDVYKSAQTAEKLSPHGAVGSPL